MREDQKKIMMITSALSGGGAEKIFCWLSEKFRNNGYSVRVYSMLEPKDKKSTENVIFLKWKSEKDYPGLIWKLKKEIDSWSPDIIIGWSTLTNLAVVLAYKISRRTCKVVLCERSIVSETVLYANMAKRFLIKKLIKWLYPMADVIACNSASASEDLIHAFSINLKKVVVVPNPVDTEMVKSKIADEPEEFKKITRPVMLCVSRLSPEKGIIDLLETIALKMKDVKGSFVIIGDGPMKDDCLARIDKYGLKDRVFLLGYRHEPYNYMHHADLLILPSRHEGFPNVVLEGMAAGTAVVATECCSNIVEMKNYGCCITAKVCDSEELAAAIRKGLSQSQKQLLIENADAFVCRFTPENVFEQFCNLC